MKSGKIIPRLVETRLQEALGDSPVVLIHGPRQCGKTTLAQRVGRKLGYAYFNLDEDVPRAAAEADPVGFVAELPERVVLDEVQRVPNLFTALKLTVDRDRAPGRAPSSSAARPFATTSRCLNRSSWSKSYPPGTATVSAAW